MAWVGQPTRSYWGGEFFNYHVELSLAGIPSASRHKIPSRSPYLNSIMTKTRDFLGPYRLTRLIRVGSTAEVWEAIEENSQERFALKVLKQSLATDKNEVALLKHEFNVAKDLSSPRIIKIFEYREEGGRPLMVLELFSELNMKQAFDGGRNHWPSCSTRSSSNQQKASITCIPRAGCTWM